MESLGREVLIKRTVDRRTAAVLLAEGFKLQGGQETGRQTKQGRPIIEFNFLVAAEEEQKADRLIACCRNANYDVSVHLGDYERGFRQINDFIKLCEQEFHPREGVSKDAQQEGRRAGNQ